MATRYILPVIVKQLKGTGIPPSMVVGFPHGASRPEVKALEAKLGIEDGAKELDMVMNIGKFLSGDEDWVRRDIEGVVAEAKQAGDVLVKVILETCYLTPEQIARAFCSGPSSTNGPILFLNSGFYPAPRSR